MITCPNCGTQNEPGSHFCEQCGANLGSLSSPATPTGAFVPPVQTTSQPGRPVWVPGQGWVTDGATQHPQPAPIRNFEQAPPARRSWLWVLLMAIALLIVLCCVSSLYFSTSRGTDQLNRLSTWSAEHK